MIKTGTVFSVSVVGFLLLFALPTNILANNRNSYSHISKPEKSSDLVVDDSDLNINNYYIQHQGFNILGLKVKYQTLNLDIDPHNIYRQIDRLLLTYPNETDYWEVMNCYITKKILLQNPAISSISITLAVHPNFEFPFPRSSTVTQTNQGKRQEFWHFEFQSDSIKKSGKDTLKINVAYTYKTNNQYPDFIAIYHQIKNFLTNHTNDIEHWDDIRERLTKTITQKYPMLSSFSIDLDVLNK